ncbi:hypothetical protein WOC76_23645 [Methylocystis sp. IM3]|uniref:hypothetical protein n=1 Tax=unclassified Methylocystis TaxID=2625913 RepID=UPI00311A05AD
MNHLDNVTALKLPAFVFLFRQVRKYGEIYGVSGARKENGVAPRPADIRETSFEMIGADAER